MPLKPALCGCECGWGYGHGDADADVCDFVATRSLPLFPLLAHKCCSQRLSVSLPNATVYFCTQLHFHLTTVTTVSFFFGLGTLHKDFSAWLGHTFWGNQRFSRLAYAFISPKPRRWIPSSHRMRLLQKLIKIVITLPPPLLFSDSNYNYNSGSNFQLRP